MSAAKHTPGEWIAKREGWSTVYVEARIRPGVLQEVAACGPTEAGPEQQDANARLITAAPELLTELKAADDLLMLALATMSSSQKASFAAASEAMGLGVDGATRHRERAAALAKAVGSAA